MLELNPRKHFVRNTPLSDWLAREFPEHPLFVFWNGEARVWEIGEWAGGPHCIERCIIGPRLQSFNKDMAQQLRYELSGAMGRDIRSMAKYTRPERDQIRRTMDQQKDTESWYRWLNNKLGHRSHPTIRTMAGLSPE